MRPFILAFHRLRRTPGFTLSALLVLALGIGVNVLLVSSFRGSLDQSPSFRDPARVLMIRTGTRQQRPDWRQLAAIQVNELRAQTRTLDAWVGVRDSLAMLQLDGQGERIPVGLVTLGGLSSLGVPFELGRDLTDPEGVLLSHGAWVRRFGQDPGVLGRSLWVDGKARRVAGVLAQGVRLPWMLERSEAFLPLTFSPEEASNRDSGACWVFAHLCPGQSLQAAQRELAQLAPVVASSAQREEAWTLTAETISAMALKDSLSEILVLGLAGGFLLLLVCANVAGLFLARLETRARESALRSALGASRASLLWDQGRECLLLGAGAVGLGTALVLLGSRLLGGALGPIHLDAGLALTAVLLGLATTLGTSLAPVWLGSRVDLRTLLSQGGAGNLGSGLGWRKGLVVAQLALTSLLLTGTGLAGQLLRHMQNTDPGLNVNQVIAVDYQLPSRLAGEGGSAVNLALLRQLEAQPGVQAAALASAMPLYHRGDTARIWAERAAESSVNASCEQVSSAYFQTLGIALRQGRALDDRREDECVVSESLARRLWPTAGPAGPLGQRLSVQGSHGRWLTLVGVVADHRHNGLDCVPVDQIFTPCASYAQVTLLVRSAWTAGGPEGLCPGPGGQFHQDPEERSRSRLRNTKGPAPGPGRRGPVRGPAGWPGTLRHGFQSGHPADAGVRAAPRARRHPWPSGRRRAAGVLPPYRSGFPPGRGRRREHRPLAAQPTAGRERPRPAALPGGGLPAGAPDPDRRLAARPAREPGQSGRSTPGGLVVKLAHVHTFPGPLLDPPTRLPAPVPGADGGAQ